MNNKLPQSSPVESKPAFTSAKATDLSSYVLQLLQNVEASMAAFDVDKLSDGQLQQRIEQAKKIVAAQKEEDRASIDSAARCEELKQETHDASSASDIMDSHPNIERRDSRSRSDRRNASDDCEHHVLMHWRWSPLLKRRVSVTMHFHIYHDMDTAIILVVREDWEDTETEYSIEKARSLYRQSLKCGFKNPARFSR